MSNKFADWRKNNPEKRQEQRRREKVRQSLRKRGILPPSGYPMTEEQEIINEQISNNDFSYWEKIKNKPYNDGGLEKRIKNISDEQYYLWKKTKKYCNENNYFFDLKMEDIIIPELCPYLEVSLTTDVKNENLDNFYTLDRINTRLGFNKKNIIVISKLASEMKNNCENEILIKFAKNILTINNN